MVEPLLLTWKIVAVDDPMQIAYAVAKSSGLQSSLWICNADGSNRHLLLADGGSPAWAVARIAFP